MTDFASTVAAIERHTGRPHGDVMELITRKRRDLKYRVTLGEAAEAVARELGVRSR